MRGKLFEMIFGDYAIEAMTIFVVSLFVYNNFIFSTGYRKWWIYKAIMGSQAKEAGYRTFRKKKKAEPPPDTPAEEEPKE